METCTSATCNACVPVGFSATTYFCMCSSRLGWRELLHAPMNNRFNLKYNSATKQLWLNSEYTSKRVSLRLLFFFCIFVLNILKQKQALCLQKNRTPVYWTKMSDKNYHWHSFEVSFGAIVLSNEILDMWTYFPICCCWLFMCRAYHVE